MRFAERLRRPGCVLLVRSSLAFTLGVVTTWQTLEAEVEYPVCGRHRWTSAVAGRLSRRSLFNLTFGVITVSCGLIVIFQVVRKASGLPPTFNADVLGGVLSVACLGIVQFLTGRRLTPVRLLDADGQTMVLWIRNEEYAREFLEANASRVEGLMGLDCQNR